jgi:hypothetical protein
MDRGFNIPWIRGSTYHGKGVHNTIRGVQYTMDRGVKIPWVGGTKYHGVQNTIGFVSLDL